MDRRLAVKVAREFARNAEVSGGRSMICMGAGTNHWFHSDETYRSFISLLLLCGCVGINGGGWAHYVGQEKIRTFAGWQAIANGLDWRRPPRQAQGTSWYYTHTEQWRYDRLHPDRFASPLGHGLFKGRTAIDEHARAVRMGWMPGHPTFDRNPLDLADEGGDDPAAHVVDELKAGRLNFAVDDPSAPPASRACSSSGARTCSGPRARGRSTSCATCSAPRTTARWPSRCRRTSGPPTCAGATRSRTASSTCWSTSTSG